MRAQARSIWVSYLRVSTPEQAAKDLSLPAQREAVAEYARRSGQEIAQEYLESGCSGTDINRKAFRQMLEDVLRPGSDIGTIVVHHTSRFTRNATQARVVKEQLRKKGVKVVSVCQDLNDDPIGQLIEGIFECIDQYESEVNGMRTAAAMREAVRQGFFPGAIPPDGFKAEKVEVRPALVRSVLVVNHDEAAIVRELFRLYVANNGAKSVARALNQRGSLYRNGKPWSKDLVLRVLGDEKEAGLVPRIPVSARLEPGFFARLVTPAHELSFIEGCKVLAQGLSAEAISHFEKAAISHPDGGAIQRGVYDFELRHGFEFRDLASPKMCVILRSRSVRCLW